jgi:hypothetical protein
MLAENIHFNVPQETFTLFYAITWGTAANSQPRWKGFAWGAIGEDPPSERRAWMSVEILNVLPLAYFVFILWWLSARAWEDRGIGLPFAKSSLAYYPHLRLLASIAFGPQSWSVGGKYFMGLCH